MSNIPEVPSHCIVTDTTSEGERHDPAPVAGKMHHRSLQSPGGQGYLINDTEEAWCRIRICKIFQTYRL
ncbi:hypothetical protein ACH5RR_016184 [Cinchona calisaya]|uniref:Uncharacterized protein n=1 Tax=Cinchona calisaya TaxID=153742 RepID=A0ABD2ZYM7_9GENT